MSEDYTAFPGCRFYVDLKLKKDGGLDAVFTEASGLNIEMAVEEVEEGGNNGFVHRLPGRCKIGNLTLKKGMTASTELFDWVMQVAQGKIEPRHVTITLFDLTGKTLRKWDLNNAYPIKWTGPQFRADDKAIAIETLELAHQGLQVE